MIPKGSRIFPLLPGTKDPATENGHKDARTAPDRPGYPSKNYGIALDGQYIVVDLDKSNPERDELEASLPPTWSQRTGGKSPDGMHYLYRVPEGYKGKRIIGYKVNGVSVGDILASGYIVGPKSFVNSQYSMVNDVEPTLAPDWLIEIGKATHTEATPGIQIECDGITENHDNNLYLGLVLLAQNLGLTKPALKKVLREGLYSVLEGTDPSNPYTEEDDERLTSSAVSNGTYKPMQLVEEEDDEAWVSAFDLPDEQEIIEWVLYRFIPQHKLTLQYGTGGIGKSTWISYLVGTLIQKGLKVGFSATEESFDHFSNGVRLSIGKDFKKEQLKNLINIQNFWKFSRDEEKLRKKLETCPLDFIYFDSIYDVFNVKRGLTEDTRPSLTPLSKIAEECKVTILGTFHENKSGEFNGSKDMESVPRCLIHATRESDTQLRLHVKKANKKKPDYDLLTVGAYQPETNPNGTPVMERNEHGILTPDEIFIVTGFDKAEKSTEGMLDLGTTEDSTNDEAMRKVRECKQANPSWGEHRISEATGLGRTVVELRLKHLKNT